jgi:seryl-tRNA synthetase
MLDIKLIRSNPEEVAKRLAKRDPKLADEVPLVVEHDTRYRAALTRAEQLQAERNSASAEIGKLMQQGKKAEAEEARVRVRDINLRREAMEAEAEEYKRQVDDWLYRTPNLPEHTTPAGGEENNEILHYVGELPKFDFAPKPHWELVESLDLVDFTRGVKLTGSGFILYKGLGALLERALIQFMLDLHIEKHGYTEWSTPFLLNRESMIGSAHLPKFQPEMYHDEEDDLFALPTAEPALLNIHRDEILSADQLPLNYVAYSPCWRREAGAAGKDTRGIQRVHQFDKVEMVKFTLPETSYDEQEKLLKNATDVLDALGLAYRVVQLAAGDLGFAATKCYDAEVFAPGADKWLEVSSCSNCEDFQARRANIRFRRDQGAKPEFVHILNGSGTALQRLMAALLETYQTEDGSVELPTVLHPYMKGRVRLEKPA